MHLDHIEESFVKTDITWGGKGTSSLQLPVGGETHTPSVFRGDASCPGYRSNLEKMGEKESEILGFAEFSGRDTNVLVPLSILMVEQHLGPLPPT